MKLRDCDSTIRITMSRDDLYDFAASWPGSGIEWGDRMSVTIDAANGDLVDYAYNGRFPEPERVNGLALRALADKANNYAARTLTRPELSR